MHRLVWDILARAGITGFSSEVLDRPDQRLALHDMKHPMGTTRMSSTPGTGVVNTECRVHGVKNLYVAGSSVFPTGGHANPTLLIVALAARLAGHLGHIAEPHRNVNTLVHAST
jgi:choline dehydrogenase-like flavoprotein